MHIIPHLCHLCTTKHGMAKVIAFSSSFQRDFPNPEPIRQFSFARGMIYKTVCWILTIDHYLRENIQQ